MVEANEDISMKMIKVIEGTTAPGLSYSVNHHHSHGHSPSLSKSQPVSHLGCHGAYLRPIRMIQWGQGGCPVYGQHM